MISKKVSETRLWGWLSAARKIFRERLHICRIENLVLTGMPDCEGCLDSIQFWLELKTEARPSNPETKIKVRFEPDQIPWLKRRVEAGGNAFVLLQVGSGRKASRYLIWGKQAYHLEDGMTEKELLVISLCDPKASATEILRAAAKH